jgi:hypothetical protein
MVDRWFPVGGSRPFRMSFEILKFLVLNPGKTPFAIEKATKIDRPTVYAAIDLLHRAQLIEKEGEKKHAMGVSRTYVANVRGFVALLQADSREIILNPNESRPRYFKVTKKDIQAFAEKKELQDFLPMIFGKWKHFRDVGAEDLAYEQLLVAANDVASESNDEVRKLSEISKGADPSPFDTLEGAPAVLRDEIYEQMFRRRFFNADKSRDRFGQAISADPEILQRIERQIQWEQKTAIQEEAYLDMCLRIIRGEPTKRRPVLVDLSAENSEWLDKFAKARARYERAVGLDKGTDPSTLPTEKDISDDMFNNIVQESMAFVVVQDPHGKGKFILEEARAKDDRRQKLVHSLRSIVDRYQSQPEIYGKLLREMRALPVSDVKKFMRDAESLARQLEEIDGSNEGT